jgi:uracil-DNA glycosylase family protein
VDGSNSNSRTVKAWVTFQRTLLPAPPKLRLSVRKLNKVCTVFPQSVFPHSFCHRTACVRAANAQLFQHISPCGKRKNSVASNKTEYSSAAALIPAHSTLLELRTIAAGCRACDLWKKGTQTVFGEGPAHARVMFVGEQPGDREDIEGRPFVGPAGRILDEALLQAGIPRDDVYVTNVVKHFRWEAASRGKRRIHKKPRASEINACRPWLDAELALVQPAVLVCLGATAAQSLLGKDFSVLRSRGEPVTSALAPYVMATVHPSSILRSPDSETRQAEMKHFVEDLRKIVPVLRKLR